MALNNTAKTRIGLGGPMKNYTRPVAAKGIVAVIARIRDFPFFANVGRFMQR